MSSMPTRIKHCGITSLDDAQRAAEAGAWAIGMIFWDGSPRRCELDEAQVVGTALRRTLNLVGRLRQRAPGGDRSRRPDGGALARAAARRRGTGLLQRGRAPHRRQGHQGRPRAVARDSAGRGCLPHRLPAARCPRRGRARRHRPHDRLGARAPGEARPGGDPQRRAEPRTTSRPRSPPPSRSPSTSRAARSPPRGSRIPPSCRRSAGPFTVPPSSRRDDVAPGGGARTRE